MGLAEMKTDTDSILDTWGETLIVKRRSVAYGSTGKGTTTWATVGTTITGDWQPLSGSAIIEEQGLEVKSSSQILAAFNVNVLPGDQIYRADGSYEYVNYIVKHEDHMEIRMKLTEEG